MLRMPRSIGVNDLLIFAQVAESRGFSAASRVLDIPKSTMSRRVSELEAVLGVRLLQRTTRTLSLTDVGRAYAERSRELRSEIDEANEVVASAGVTPRRQLRCLVRRECAESGSGREPLPYRPLRRSCTSP